MKKAKLMFRRIMKTIKLEEMQILPGQLAFFIVLAIFSIIPLLGFIGSNFITKELIASFEETLPGGISSIFKYLMDTNTAGFSVAFFTICSIYIASSGCEAMIITSNVIYKIKNNNFLKQKIKAIIMTFILIILILFIVLVPAFGELIITSIQKHYDNRLMGTVSQIFGWLKYPLSFILIFIGIKILYTLAPDKTIGSHNTNYGALFTTILWILVTRVYAIYLNNINTYNIFYGSLANVVIMLFWIYLLAYIFTLGMALNVEKYNNANSQIT